MKRLVLVAALLGGACGTTDDRPRTLEYITQTILAPTCAVAECHSAFKQEVGDQFDTVEATRRSIVGRNAGDSLVNIDMPPQSTLYRSITVGAGSVLTPGTIVRMPYDAPMPDADAQLILGWIEDGAHGAQCVPNDVGEGCSYSVVAGALVYNVVKCVDGDIGAVVMVCPPAKKCSLATGNGQCN